MEKFRFGNLAAPDVLADHFTQYNLSASKAREGFARVAKQLIVEGKKDEAEALLDRGLEVLPSPKIRYSDSNTLPFIEGFYSLGKMEKGAKMLVDYFNVLREYIEYYLQFDGVKADLVSSQINQRMDTLLELYYMAAFARRDDIVKQFNDYLRTFGYKDDELITPGTDPATMIDSQNVDL